MSQHEEIQMIQGPAATYTAESCTIKLLNKDAISIPRNEVLSIRDFLNEYLKRYGYWDTFGREVVP